MHIKKYTELELRLAGALICMITQHCSEHITDNLNISYSTGMLSANTSAFHVLYDMGLVKLLSSHKVPDKFSHIELTTLSERLAEMMCFSGYVNKEILEDEGYLV